MRSPPPTPRRDAAAAAAALDQEQRTRVSIDLSNRTQIQMQSQTVLHTQYTTQSRGLLKRTRDQAGLITPRPTPTTARKGPTNRVDDGTAKILFPASSKKRKVTVFQDPKTPDPFADDLENPFLSGGSNDLPLAADGKQGGQGSQLPDLREDGMFYVFRGKKVFRPFPTRTTRSGSRAVVEEETRTEERRDTTAEVRPKRLFTVEIERKRQWRSHQKQSELATASIAEDVQEEDDVLGDMLELPLDGPRMRRSLFD